jgi:hypothetical protein
MPDVSIGRFSGGIKRPRYDNPGNGLRRKVFKRADGRRYEVFFCICLTAFIGDIPLRLCALWFSGLTFLALLRSWPFRKIGIENQPSAVNVC